MLQSSHALICAQRKAFSLGREHAPSTVAMAEEK
jgi:hypothetical protein